MSTVAAAASPTPTPIYAGSPRRTAAFNIWSPPEPLVLHRAHLTINEATHSPGPLADTYSGTYNMSPHRPAAEPTQVTVKTIKVFEEYVRRYPDRAATDADGLLHQFYCELDYVIDFPHMNMSAGLGVVLDPSTRWPKFLILEAQQQGTIDTYFHDNQSRGLPLSVDVLLSMCIDVLTGLWVLHTLPVPIVHGNLGMHSVAYDTYPPPAIVNLRCRLSDFGVTVLYTPLDELKRPAEPRSAEELNSALQADMLAMGRLVGAMASFLRTPGALPQLCPQLAQLQAGCTADVSTRMTAQEALALVLRIPRPQPPPLPDPPYELFDYLAVVEAMEAYGLDEFVPMFVAKVTQRSSSRSTDHGSDSLGVSWGQLRLDFNALGLGVGPFLKVQTLLLKRGTAAYVPCAPTRAPHLRSSGAAVTLAGGSVPVPVLMPGEEYLGAKELRLLSFHHASAAALLPE